ncbi:metal ABC transporter substrate-binding protein [Planctomycetota bacterium]
MSKKIVILMLMVLLAAAGIFSTNQAVAQEKKALHVVTTLPDYAYIAQKIGGDRITVEHIVQGVQDPHNIRPKPSFIQMIKRADMLVATGLDLEMWLPSVIDKSGNSKVRSGEKGYVSVSDGIPLIEIPKVLSMIEGDVHTQGNPHFTCGPLNMRKGAKNISIGLIKNDPENKTFYEENLKKFQDEIAVHLFGQELVKLFGGDLLCRLARQDNLIKFLEDNKLQGEPLIGKLGGWMKKMMPLRGTPIITFHKNWSYMTKLYGLEVPVYIEPKPGIPPSAKHVNDLIKLMGERNIRILFCANYFDERKVKTIADRVNAAAVIVPLYVGGAENLDEYIDLMDYWTDELLKAAQEKGIIEK